MRRYTTKAEDRQWMQERMADFIRNWKVGDAVQSFKPGVLHLSPTTIVSIEGEIIRLADGSEGHVSKLRSPR